GRPSGTNLRGSGGPRLVLGADEALRSDVLELEAAAGGDGTGLLELLKRLDRRVDDVDRVRRAERLRQHVVDAGALEHGAHGTTGDDTGTGGRRTQQHDTGGGLTLHGVRDGRADARDTEEVLLRLLDAL